MVLEPRPAWKVPFRWAATAVVLATPAAAVGQEICVSCDAPAAIYRCSVEHADRLKLVRQADRWLHLACIKDIAQQYGHATCAINPASVGSCEGIVHVVKAQSAATHVLNRPSPTEAVQPAEPPAGPAPAAPRNSEPKTVVELAKQTAESTQKGLDKATKKVTDTAKKTWKCLTSLFSAC